MGLIKEFKAFAIQGNVVELATAVIIGGAFGKIVSSVVDDILMPPIGLAMGGVNFKDLKLVLKAGNEAAKVAEVAIKYGNFMQNVIDFLIVAICIFTVIKGINAMKKKEEVVEAAQIAPPAPSNEEVLLSEIRDLLKQGR
jgi:large conductance mechanosensitive channel